MTKLVWPVMAFIVVAYFVNSSIEGNEARDLARQQEALEQEAFRARVSQFIEDNNANDSWQESLAGEDNFRLRSILTIELEREWLQEQPILFLGEIKDIATFSDSEYLITLGEGFYGSIEYFIDTEIQLSLIAGKQIIDNFIDQNPDALQDIGINNGVLVAARIREIGTDYAISLDGTREEIRIGSGELVDIIFTGSNRL